MVWVPEDQRFYLEDAGRLRDEIRRLAIALPMDEHAGGRLCEPLALGKITVANRFMVRGTLAHEAGTDGTPSRLTVDRHAAWAGGGAGLVVTEPVAMTSPGCPEPRPGVLTLSAADVCRLDAFSDWVATMRAAASASHTAIWLGLDETGMAGLDAGACRERYAVAAGIARTCGFDGVEIRWEDADAMADIERATGSDAAGERPDHADVRLVQAVEAVREACPDLSVGVRVCVFAARTDPPGFGTDAHDYRRFNPGPPVRLFKRLRHSGIHLLDLTWRHPALRLPADQAARSPVDADAYPHEHPLCALARGLTMAASIRAALPGLPVAMGGFSWLRQFMPLVAGGGIRDGLLDLVALDRFALAYPRTPMDLATGKGLDPCRCCIQCGACRELREAGEPVGCVIRDPQRYGPIYRRLLASGRRQTDARRCHQCMPAPCVPAIPGRPDVPRLMLALGSGDVERAGTLLRRRQPLPEMCASLCPYGDSGERECIETVLSGSAVPIRDLLFDAACRSRHMPSAKVRIPDRASGRRIVVAGGGPAGIAASATLLAHGHAVTLYERSDDLGGVPERLIPVARYPGGGNEIRTLLGPALDSGRLRIQFNSDFADVVSESNWRHHADAVLLTIGLWKERTLGEGTGIYPGPVFLEAVKRGRLSDLSGSSVVLAGGDCAMDAALVLHMSGADPLTIVFGGPRSQMHWCMEESWFNRPGVHVRLLCRPVSYVRSTDGRLKGVRCAPMDALPGGQARDLAGSDFTIAADRVVEAMGTVMEDAWLKTWPGLTVAPRGWLLLQDPDSYATGIEGVFAAGAMINGGASVSRCVQDGVDAADAIHAFLR